MAPTVHARLENTNFYSQQNYLATVDLSRRPRPNPGGSDLGRFSIYGQKSNRHDSHAHGTARILRDCLISSPLIYVNARMNSFQRDLTSPGTQKHFDANDT